MGDVIDLGDFQVLAKVDRRLEHREHVELDALVHLHYTAMLPYYTKLKAMLPEQARARYAHMMLCESGGVCAHALWKWGREVFVGRESRKGRERRKSVSVLPYPF